MLRTVSQPGNSNQRFALGTEIERVFAEIARTVEVGLYVYQVVDDVDPGSLRLVYANPASASATGVAVERILGMPLREAFPGLMETSIPKAYLEIALGGEARDVGEVDYGDERVAKQVFSVRAFPLSNRNVGISFTNLTSQRVAEQRAVQTLESMSDAFMTVDTEWRFTYVNPQGESILDRRREDLIGKNMWEEFPESVGSRFYDAYLEAVRDQVPVQIEETYEPLGRTLEARAYPVTDGLAVFFTDVTTQRLQDERLRQTQRLEAIGRVTASVAHDFNNLLTAILGFASLGQADSGDGKAGFYFDQIDSAGQKAVELTRQLLAFGRKQDLSPTVFDLNEMVEGLSSLLHQVVPADIELRFALAGESVPVFMDKPQLEQVLLNLVVNSRDAITGSGSITICTSIESPVGLIHDVRGESGWLQVADTGAGIPADVRPHIFEPFYTTKPPETGTGLGLATIHGIIMQSGGAIFVDSASDAGTTMSVALPRDDLRESSAESTVPGHRFGSDAASTAESISYRINAENVIVRVSDSFDEFASRNGAPKLSERILGYSLFDSIAGLEPKMLWRTLLDDVRSGNPFSLLYRCDAAEERRELRMTVTAHPDGSVDFVSSAIALVARVPIPINRQARGGALLRACSWCCRFDIGTWVEAEEAVRQRRLLVAGSVTVTHGICPDCSRRVMGELSLSTVAS
ncbi:MAG: PAS domain-containing protein [Gemmatimonadaceae bacterium]|nr:PAS domain-containing protein [Gemmatimonadaceae bacterium]